ncbi:MAG: metallophosphoesterase [Phycisphaerae bacterium]
MQDRQATGRRWHLWTRRAAIGTLVGVAASPWLARLADVPISRPIGFRLVMLFLLAATALWWSVAEGWLSGRGAGAASRRWSTAWRTALAGWALLMAAPAAVMLVSGRGMAFVRVPMPLASVFQFWHMLVALVAAAGVVVALLVAAARRVRRLARTSRRPVEPDRVDALTRRAWLRGAVIHAPIAIVTAGSMVADRNAGRFIVRQFELPAPWLPDRLRGLSITHISDLHVGRLYRPQFLPRLVDEANRLAGDIVVVTGDVIDFSNDMLPPSIAALRQLESRHGRFLCVGNHDLMDNGAVYVQAIRTAGLDLLVNEARRVEIGGERVTIAGVDWLRRSAGPAEQAAYAAAARAALAGHDERRDGPSIVLAHHPHAFDALEQAGARLVLSGHTHGGQLMAGAPPADGWATSASDRGVGQLLFRYLRGFYRRGAATLFVNSGVGNWFPLRVNAPAEIVRLRLV